MTDSLGDDEGTSRRSHVTAEQHALLEPSKAQDRDKKKHESLRRRPLSIWKEGCKIFICTKIKYYLREADVVQRRSYRERLYTPLRASQGNLLL